MALPPLSTLKPSFDSKGSNIRQTFALIRTSGMDHRRRPRWSDPPPLYGKPMQFRSAGRAYPKGFLIAL
jgi:hypothetical protein